MSADDAPPTPTPPSGDTRPAGDTPLAIDLERLAEKVYQLMLAEARLARARRER